MAHILSPKDRILIVGVSHPRGKEDDYTGGQLREEDIMEIVENSRNRDEVVQMIYEHEYFFNKDYKPIGYFTDYSADDLGRLVVVGHLDIRSKRGLHAFYELKSGKLIGMSVGLKAKTSQDKKHIISRRLWEISLTSDPALADTEIIYCGGIPLSTRRGKKESYSKLLKTGLFFFI